MRFKITNIQLNKKNSLYFDITVDFMNNNNIVLETVNNTLKKSKFKSIEELLIQIGEIAKKQYNEYLMQNFTTQTVSNILNKVYDIFTLQEIV